MTADRSSQSRIYDGFISYSHAADDLLAPRLQAGLQRFAKPWWKRRAVRMFRDESSLAANPHLWSSITEALDSSQWFVLLLSEDAASSEWVGREIDHWLANKDSGRILPVVTGGEFWWADGEVAGSSVPPALRGVFSEEPRWVDLRFARGDELLDLKNPDFSAAVADISSAIRGIPKDELASEEVRQHRRTIRTAWAAGVLVGVLGVAAVVFGVQANEQRELAEHNAEVASANEARASANAEEARINAEEAVRQRDLAIANEAEARANELFAVRQARIDEANRILAITNLAEGGDPTRTVSLALYAAAVAGENVGEIETTVTGFLQAALPRYRVAMWWKLGEPERAVVAPDGATLFYLVTNQESRVTHVEAFATATSEVIWSQQTRGEIAGELAVSPDGSQVAVAVAGGQGATLVVHAAETGAVVAAIELGACNNVASWGPGFSPDGRYYTQFTGTSECRTDGAGSWVNVYETTEWTEIARIQNTPDQSGGQGGLADTVHFSADGTIVLISGQGSKTQLRSFPDLELIRDFGTGHLAVALSPDATLLALQPTTGHPVLVDAQTGDQLGLLELDGLRASSEDDPISFSPDGSRIMIHMGSKDFLFDAATRALVYAFEHGYAHQHSWTSDSRYLFESTGSGLFLWHVGDELDGAPLPFDFPALISEAVQRLGRGFTEVECPTFLIEPCLSDPDQLRSFILESLPPSD